MPGTREFGMKELRLHIKPPLTFSADGGKNNIFKFDKKGMNWYKLYSAISQMIKNLLTSQQGGNKNKHYTINNGN